ncbi:MAG: MCE family protein [Verrucomicrobia bacterium]|nr:MCE family protein [Verrucomicrobiota bacterium]
MSHPRLPAKVGLFVFVTLLLLVGLILSFSKGLSIFNPSYVLNLQTANVGGIKEQAQVLVGGVRVGSVSRLTLAGNGKTVVLKLRLDRRYPLRQDARFVIEQSGFLGDQHVAVYPQSTDSPLLMEGAIVQCEEPFNLQEAARAATGFIQRVDQTAQRINDAVQRIDRMVLNDTTLSNISLSMANLRRLSEKSLALVDRLDGLAATNAAPVNTAVSNLLSFARAMEQLGRELNATVAENREGLNRTLKHAEAAGQSVEDLAKRLGAGEGVAGSLVKDADVREAWRQTVFNFSLLSSNLNRYGLLYKPRAPRKDSGVDNAGGKGGSLIRQ